MRDALSMLDQAIIFGKGKVEETEINAMLGTIDQTYLYDLLEALIQKDGARMLAVADAIEVRSLSFDTALQNLAGLFHSLALVQIVPQAISEDVPEHEKICSLAKEFTPEDLQLFYQIALHGRADLGLAPDEYSGFTMALMRMLAFAPESSSENITVSHSSSSIVPKEKLPLFDGKLSKSNINTTHTSPPALNVVTALSLDSCTNQLNSDWAILVNQLKLNGMAKMLAQNCEMKNFSTDNIELCVQAEHKHLLEKTYQDKIKKALSEHFGKPVRLKLSVGSVTGMTPAELDTREKQAKHLQAVAAIETDPFVRELVDNFDAKLIISSIKPI